MNTIDTWKTILEIIFAALLLMGIWNREKILKWEAKHLWWLPFPWNKD